VQQEIPVISRFLFRWFAWYVPRYLRKHFHAVRLDRSSVIPSGKGPFVVFMNHASWWDPMVCVLLAERYFRGCDSFAPIDAKALEKYGFFRKLGFFGVEQGTPRGAVQFVRTTEALLAEAGRALWITPQGRFADVRERPLQFQPGLGHLAARTPGVRFIPLAIEYNYWTERLPEVLVRFGDPILGETSSGFLRSSADWTTVLESALARTQDALSASALAHDSSSFSTLLDGAAGTSIIYDGWRRLRAALQGRAFSSEHANHPQAEARR